MEGLSEEQRMLVDSLELLARKEFEPNAFEWMGETPRENIKLLADRGFLGINISTEFGGGGMSEFEAMLSIEIVGQVCPDTAQYLYEQQMVAPRAIEMFGSQQVKERYLPPVTAGDAAIAIGISEPEAGSDVGAMETTVEEHNGELVLDGQKTWVSSVKDATAIVVWVKFSGGLGTIVVDMDEPGVEVGQHYTNMAGHTQSQLYFSDVKIPQENVLTRGSNAFKRQLKALNWERLGSTALANALGRCAMQQAIEYAGDRKQFGQPIAEFQGIEWKLADMVAELRASESIAHSAALKAVARDRNPDRLSTSIAKLYSANMVEYIVSEALQIHGANGYQRGHPLEYLYRMARARRIAAGTDEMQRNSIATVLKRDGLPDLV